MTKAEFLEKLRIELSSGVTPQVLQENLNYYGQYIDDEIRKGRTESEVLAELGDPWILAKTIVDAQREESVEDVIYDSDGRTYRGNSSTEESSNIHDKVQTQEDFPAFSIWHFQYHQPTDVLHLHFSRHL